MTGAGDFLEGSGDTEPPSLPQALQASTAGRTLLPTPGSLGAAPERKMPFGGCIQPKASILSYGLWASALVSPAKEALSTSQAFSSGKPLRDPPSWS